MQFTKSTRGRCLLILDGKPLGPWMVRALLPSTVMVRILLPIQRGMKPCHQCRLQRKSACKSHEAYPYPSNGALPPIQVTRESRRKSHEVFAAREMVRFPCDSVRTDRVPTLTVTHQVSTIHYRTLHTTDTLTPI